MTPARSHRSSGNGGLVVLALALLCVFARPESASGFEQLDRIFAEGNSAYYRGDYVTAIERYERIVDAGIEDPDVFFNLATAYARAGQYGQAIRFYEHTLRLNAGDEGAEQGLALAETAAARTNANRAGEAVAETRTSIRDALLRPFSENFLGWLLVGANIAFFGLLFALRVVRRETGRLALGVAIPIVGVFLLVSGTALAFKTEAFMEGTPAIVIVPQTTLLDGPDRRARSRGVANEGERARIVDRNEGWVLVRVDTKREGWTRARDVGPIARTAR